jgi:type VI secretion system protein ImpL
VRGVGGTRNCDWWFTNEAILLDTAGRYTTESDDRDEWIAFLQCLLRTARRSRSTACSWRSASTSCIDANEQQIESTGKKIRARIDEVMTQLTWSCRSTCCSPSVDLIAGFVEFFGDLKKSDRRSLGRDARAQRRQDRAR